MKRYVVELETYETDEVIVEAENEEQAREIAADIMGYDWEVIYVDEVED